MPRARSASTSPKGRCRKAVPGDIIKSVKVVKTGELSTKVALKGIGATAGAKAAIEAAGGSVSE